MGLHSICSLVLASFVQHLFCQRPPSAVYSQLVSLGLYSTSLPEYITMCLPVLGGREEATLGYFQLGPLQIEQLLPKGREVWHPHTSTSACQSVFLDLHLWK